MNSTHYGLTLSKKIIPSHLKDLEAALKKLEANQLFNTPLFPFEKLTTTHFITWVILPEEQQVGGKLLPPRLLLMSSFTGSKKEHINELVSVGLAGLHEVYQHCENYPYEHTPGYKEMVRYVRKISVLNTYYTGFHYISPKMVGDENELRERIQDFLDAKWKGGGMGSDPTALRKQIQEHIKKQPDLGWATKPYKRTTEEFLELFGPLIIFGIVMGGSLILTILHFFIGSTLTTIGLIIFGGFIGLVLVLLILLRINEANPHVDVLPATDQRIYDITSKETNPVKNEMTVAAPLKKGWIRRVFLAFTLRIVPLIRAFSYIPTVHTARWLQTDGGRRLIFIANFDNTSEAYAHDFVDSKKRTRNLNLIFGHGYGFPATKWAVGGGGKDRKRYMVGVRANQKITNLWFSTSKKLGILTINNNHEIRKGLFGKFKNSEIEQWILRL